jgi:hypothetical protein
MTIIHIVLFKISSSLDQSGILKVNKTDRAIPHYERAEIVLGMPPTAHRSGTICLV